MPATLAARPAADFLMMRRAMVDCQLRTNTVNDPAFVRALLDVAREDFVPVALRDSAYIDRALPLAAGRALNPPLTTARLIADAAPQAGQRVLLIGAATGYAAALLAQLGVQVVAIEESPELAAAARTALSAVAGVTVVEGPLTAGAPGEAPFDALIIDGAVTTLPAALLAQLADGAAISTGIAAGRVTRLARAVAVAGAETLHPMPYLDLECVVLPGFATPRGFQF